MGQEEGVEPLGVYKDSGQDDQAPSIVTEEFVDPLKIALPPSALTSPELTSTPPAISPFQSSNEFEFLGMLSLCLEEFLPDPGLAIRDDQAEEKEEEEEPSLLPHSEIAQADDDEVQDDLSSPPEPLHFKPVHADDYRQVDVVLDEVLEALVAPEAEDENDSIGDDSPVASRSAPSEESKVDVEIHSDAPPNLPNGEEDEAVESSDTAQGKRREFEERATPVKREPLVGHHALATSSELLTTGETIAFVDTDWPGSPIDANPLPKLYAKKT
ncbi:hypothetical protein DXG03_003250 [Asterophora parasitica]|uniref:Uncharacterized protein n=1 Tax=Asterophora parasitica TaxID=117018 RepID=A0A9P7KF47_9AGAR|nr:hypothetical protein DXG03_003250 [Asterophora parasitica]